MTKKRISIVLFLTAFAIAAYFLLPLKPDKTLSDNSEGLRSFNTETFRNATGWGYRIYENKTAIIEQQFVPGATGTNGFKTKEEAEKTAKMVKVKLQLGIFPPTISTQELDSLGIQY